MAPIAASRFVLHPAVATPAASKPAAPPPHAPVAVSPTLLRSTHMATINPALLHFQNPHFRPIFIPQPQPRANFSLPALVSPLAQPTDQTLFEDPKDPAKKFHLAVYGIASTAGSAGRAKWVSFLPTGTGFELNIHLSETTGAALAQSSDRLDATTRYLISANIQSRLVTWDLESSPNTDGAALKLTLAIADFTLRDQVYEATTDPNAQTSLILRRTLSLAVPAANNPGLYVASTVAIDTAIPFKFNRDLDANVFSQLGAVSEPASAWNIVSVNWNGRRYPYYQSTAQPDQVYFLPDAFKIARQDKTPHAPALSVSMAGSDAGSVTLTLSYLAQPVWDPARIAAAEQLLQTTLSLSAPPALALFQAADTKLRIQLPATDSGGSGFVDQKDALIDMAGGIQGSVTMSLDQFRQVYDALFDGVSPLFSGEVNVTVDKDVATIPFISRATEFVGDIFDIESNVDTANHKLTATLTNAIESPVHIDALQGMVVKNGNSPINASITSVSPQAPLDLPPSDPASTADTITVVFDSSAGKSLLGAGAGILGGLFGGAKANPGDVALGAFGNLAANVLDNNCAPVFDLSKVHVVPDATAIWHAIMQNQQVGPVTRTVALKAVAAMVKPAQPVTSDSVMAIQVVFENGQTANFDNSVSADAAGFLNQSMKLSVPIDAFVLGNADTRNYRYRVDQVTAGGVKQGDWKSDNRDVLYIVTG